MNMHRFKPEKPEGLTELEWAIYQNQDFRRIPPEIRAKVHEAMGWKPKDIADAEDIAGLVVRAVEKVDKDLAREAGHVPEENLPRYRRLKQVADTFRSLGSRLSGIGQYEDANLAWRLESKYRAIANELRADLPAEKPTLPGDDAQHHDGVGRSAVAGDAVGDDQQQEDRHQHPVQHPESNH